MFSSARSVILTTDKLPSMEDAFTRIQQEIFESVLVLALTFVV